MCSKFAEKKIDQLCGCMKVGVPRFSCWEHSETHLPDGSRTSRRIMLQLNATTFISLKSKAMPPSCRAIMHLSTTCKAAFLADAFRS